MKESWAELHRVVHKYFAYCQFTQDAAKRLGFDRINVSDGSPFLLETGRFLRKAFRTFSRVNAHYALLPQFYSKEGQTFYPKLPWFYAYFSTRFLVLSFSLSLSLSFSRARLYLLLENVKAKLCCIDNTRQTLDIRLTRYLFQVSNKHHLVITRSKRQLKCIESWDNSFMGAKRLDKSSATCNIHL